jgi:hypothetical protein
MTGWNAGGDIAKNYMKNEVNSLSETRVGKTVWKEKLRK